MDIFSRRKALIEKIQELEDELATREMAHDALADRYSELEKESRELKRKNKELERELKDLKKTEKPVVKKVKVRATAPKKSKKASKQDMAKFKIGDVLESSTDDYLLFCVTDIRAHVYVGDLIYRGTHVVNTIGKAMTIEFVDHYYKKKQVSD